MNRREQDRLFAELIGGENLPELRGRTLQAGLRAMRGRKRRRRAAQAAIFCSIALIAGWLVFWMPSYTQNKIKNMASAPASHQQPVQQPATGDIKFISDDELLDLFPNRAVALIGKPGHQELIFLE
jgi:hypothetical protein